MNLLPLKNRLTKKIGFPVRVRALEGCHQTERRERWFQTSRRVYKSRLAQGTNILGKNGSGVGRKDENGRRKV